MRSRSLFLSLCAALVALLLATPSAARAVPPPAGAQHGKPKQAAHNLAGALGTSCEGEGVIEETLNAVTIGELGAAKCAVQAAGELTGGALTSAGDSILDGVARWMIGASAAITEFVAKEMRDTTTPRLGAAWYTSQFAPLADLGAGLGLLVAVLSLASAAVRRDPRALAATLTGIARAGLGTGLVLALTSLGLSVADEVSGAVVSASPHAFWSTVAHAWGTSGFGGFESSALAMLIALVEVVFGLFVWLELVARDAAIYIAVLFFPVVLAASIWPALGSWTSRLARLELLLVVLKPVALIVLSLAGAAAAGGLSFSGGLSGSAGTILAAIVIFALAAFAPWALMYVLAADAESAYAAAGTRHAAANGMRGAGARARSTGGGLRNLGGGTPTRFVSAGGGLAGGQTGGGPGPSDASPSSPGTSGAGPSSSSAPSGSGPAGGAPTAAGANLDETLPIGAATIGTGSVGAAAGTTESFPDGTSQSHPPHASGATSSSPSLAPAPGASSPSGNATAEAAPASGTASPSSAHAPARAPSAPRAPLASDAPPAAPPPDAGPPTPQPPNPTPAPAGAPFAADTAVTHPAPITAAPAPPPPAAERIEPAEPEEGD